MNLVFPMRPRDLPRRLPDVREYLAQPKLDGWYLVLRGGRALTRTGEDLSSWACFAGRTLPEDAVGELLHVDGRNRIPSLARCAAGFRLVLFDAPSGLHLEERLGRLPDLAARYGLEYAPTFEPRTWEEAGRIVGEMQARGDEGIVLKRKGSPWVSGDSAFWYRMKTSSGAKVVE